MSEIGSTLKRELGADRVFDDDETLAAHRVDYWILAHLRRRQGRLGPPPARVVKPRSTAEVAQTIQLAQRHGTAVVPFGGGSGVVGGAVPPGGTIVLDTRAMNRLLELNEQSLYARAEAGMMGPAYEAEIGAKGYTTGHYPQSIALSTVGGWVATRAAGQFSTRYGNIEDLCLGLEAVRASGEVVRIASFPRTSIGPSLRELFLGSEGTLGVITEVTVRLHPRPEAVSAAVCAFDSIRGAVDTVIATIQLGIPVARIELLDDRHLDAIILQDPFKMGYESTKAIAMKLKGETPPASVDSGAVMVTRADLEKPDVIPLLYPDIQRYLTAK